MSKFSYRKLWHRLFFAIDTVLFSNFVNFTFHKFFGKIQSGNTSLDFFIQKLSSAKPTNWFCKLWKSFQKLWKVNETNQKALKIVGVVDKHLFCRLLFSVSADLSQSRFLFLYSTLRFRCCLAFKFTTWFGVLLFTSILLVRLILSLAGWSSSVFNVDRIPGWGFHVALRNFLDNHQSWHCF